MRQKYHTGVINEVLLKAFSRNLCVLISCIHEIGLDVPSFGETAQIA